MQKRERKSHEHGILKKMENRLPFRVKTAKVSLKIATNMFLFFESLMKM